MTSSQPSSPPHRDFSPASIIAATVMLGTLVFAGLFSGVLVATRLMQTAQMGWDQLADAIGGAIFGVSIGLIIAVTVTLRAGAKARWITASVAFVIAAVALLLLLNLPPNTGQPAPANAPTSSPP